MSEQPTERLESVDATASTLNQLIRICIDGEQRFRSAANDVSDLNLKRLFESYSQLRAELAAELQEELERHVRKPDESGRSTAALHRDGMDLKPAVAGKDEGSIISECERAEDLALIAYQAVLDSPLPNHFRSIVERQFLRIKEAHDQVRSLERAHNRHNQG